MSVPGFTIEHLGDRGLLVRFRSDPSPALTAILAGLSVKAADLKGVLDACPGLTTVLVEVQAGRREEVETELPLLAEGIEPVAGSLHEVPVTYDGEDFAWACDHLGMEPAALIGLHSGRIYDVRLLGSPGFVYLSDVAPEIALPRLEEPRRSVEGGAVGIAGLQAGIYGRPRPGGWRIIARAEQVPAIVPGDRVKFLPR